MRLNFLNSNSTKPVFCILILIIITSIIFNYTVEVREPWFGGLSDGHNQRLTGSTLKFSEYWYQEGPVNLKFTMLENPKSIEFPTLSSRDPYTSYPPGVVFPIYFASEIIGHEPDVALVMNYDLWNHFLVALFLSLIIFVFLRQLKIDLLNSLFFAIIPIIMELLLPAPLYWFQNAFFSDQAVILPFVLYIFLEVLRDDVKAKNNLMFLNIVQNIIMFYGFLTDWLFVFIALTVYIKRIISGEIVLNKKVYPFIKGSLLYWFVPLLAIALFAAQVYVLGTLSHTVSNAFFRTGVSQNGAKYLHNGLSIFLGHLTKGYGPVAIPALFISLISIPLAYYYIYKQKVSCNVEKIKKTLYLMGMLLVPCLLQVCFFRNHSVVHDFSVLKFSVPLATIPFVLLPILISFVSENSLLKSLNYDINISKYFKMNFRIFIIFLVVFAAVSSYVIYENPNYKSFFPGINNNFKIIGDSIAKNTGYNDIIFSPDFEIPENPPQQLAYSMKRVYKVNSPQALENKIKKLKIKGNYDIVVMFLKPPSTDWKEFLDNATVIRDGNFYYYILNPNNLK